MSEHVKTLVEKPCKAMKEWNIIMAAFGELKCGHMSVHKLSSYWPTWLTGAAS